MGSTTSSPTGYNSTTQAETIAKDLQIHCVNKHVIITGANSGLGFETAKVLSQNGADVVVCSRNLKNGEEAVMKIKESHPNAKVTAMQLDLSSLVSIKTFADKINGLNKPVHILINNAGIMACPREYTSDGFESQFGVNHLGHFYLTKLLLPLLARSGTKEQPARVINLSSLANVLFAPQQGIDFDDIYAKKHYDPFARYGASKLANILFTKELQRFVEKEELPIVAASVHPGVIVGTNLIRHFSLSFLTSAYGNLLFNPMGAAKVMWEPMKTVSQGSATTVFAALSPALQPGGHYADCQLSQDIHPQGLNEQLQHRLWRESTKLIDDALRSRYFASTSTASKAK